jgi:Acyl-CoA dehydrogenase, C-terminal domain
MDGDTRDLLRDSIQQLLADRGADLVAGLAELGWQEVVSDDTTGAVDLLFTEQGRAGRASACLDTVLLDAAGGDLRTADGAERPLAVIHPGGDAMCLEWERRLVIDGVALSDPRTTRGCVVAADGAESTAYLMRPDRLASATTPVAGFDPDSSLHRVRIEVPIADTEERKCDWRSAIAAGRRALAAELVGNGWAMLDIAIDHIRQRTQFGRPIGTNQTPRHRLAECHARLAGARGLIDAAWKSGTPWDAWVAKTYAGYASDTTSRTCLQLCGAIGLTSEHPLGGYAKRARVLDALYGGWRASIQDIGMTLLREEAIPAGPRI